MTFPHQSFRTRSPLLPFLLSILSGTLLTASFPPSRMDWAAWVALLPLLEAVDRVSARRAFLLGLITGLVHYMTLIYWIAFVLGHYGGLHPAATVAPLILLSAYLALYPGLFALIASRLRPASPLYALTLASFWVLLEYGRTHLLSGFPWCLMGHSQYRHPGLIQVAKLTGVFGISFLLIAANTTLWSVLRKGRRALAQAAQFIPLLGLTLLYGHLCLHAAPPGSRDGGGIRVAVVQANIDQAVKWRPAYRHKTMSTYFALSEKALRSRPDLLVWPETALPFFYQDPSPWRNALGSFARRSGTAMLFGSPAYEQRGKKLHYLNRAYLIRGGEAMPRDGAYYDKVHLVPFGEYVPFKAYLPFLDRLVQAAGDFVPGKEPGPIHLSALSVGVLICYEAIFPEPALTEIRKGAELLVNLTNDAWFGRTGAPYQHLAMAVFRAVETGRPLIRAANTGFSALVDPEGRIRARTGLFQEAVLVGKVFPSSAKPTTYARFGDLVLLPALLLAAFGLWQGKSRRE